MLVVRMVCSIIALVISICALVSSEKRAKHDRLKIEQDKLAIKYKNLREDEKAEHSAISKKQDEISIKQDKMMNTIIFLKDTELKNQGRMENMLKSQIETAKMMDTIESLLEYSAKRGKELEKYMKLCDNLKIENAKLKAENLKFEKTVEIAEKV